MSAANITLEIQGVVSESTSKRSENKTQDAASIELLGFSHNVSMPLTQVTGSHVPRTHGRCQHGEMVITKHLDLATPDLNALCCGGNNLDKVIIRLYQAKKHAEDSSSVIEYMAYEMQDVIITSVRVSGGGNGRPVETISLNYNYIMWSYKQQKHTSPSDPGGTAVSYWDLRTNQGTVSDAANNET